jgi:diguanylate cyclase (GGDEF)-like protein
MFKTRDAKLYALSAGFIVLIFLGRYLIDLSVQHKKEYYLEVQSELLVAKYQTSYRYFKIMTNDIYTMYTQNRRLMLLLEKVEKADTQKKETIKKKIYKLIGKNFRRLNHMGIAQVNFYLPGDQLFLKMDDIDYKADGDTPLNKNISLANKTKKIQEGFDASSKMLGLHFIYPLYSTKQKYLGNIEIVYSTRQILKSIADHFVYDSHILVKKSILQKIVSSAKILENYNDTWEIQNYYIENKTHNSNGDINLYMNISTQKLKDEIALKVKEETPFAVVGEYNYKNIILTFVPIASIEKIKNAAYIVNYTESDYLSNLQIERNYMVALYLVFISLLYLFSIYVIVSQNKLKELALYDNLTKLPNRTLFMVELKNELHRAQRYQTQLALFFLDLDGFKAVNDTYGHQVGDKLLSHVANLLTSTLREVDLVSRLGGDEFTVILSDIKDSNAPRKVAQNIIDEISKEIIINNYKIKIGVSIGVSIYPKDAKDIDELVKHADAMMYRSKNAGKNRVTFQEEENYV